MYLLTPGSGPKRLSSALASAGISAPGNTEKVFSVYPNPFSSQVYVLVENGNSKEVMLTVEDIAGRTVYRTKDEETGSDYSKTMDLSTLPQGVYFLVIKTENERKVEKIIKL